MSQKNRIHILGASGSGTTSIAKCLAKRTGYQHLDTDDFYWCDTSPPYTVANKPQERQLQLARALATHEQWILSGSLCGWGDIFIPRFELVIYVYVENEKRLERLKQRELMRFGEAILPGGNQHEQHQAFIEWAAGYETTTGVSRNALRHQQWLEIILCPVVRIVNERTVDESVDDILQHIALNPQR